MQLTPSTSVFIPSPTSELLVNTFAQAMVYVYKTLQNAITIHKICPAFEMHQIQRHQYLQNRSTKQKLCDKKGSRVKKSHCKKIAVNLQQKTCHV